MKQKSKTIAYGTFSMVFSVSYFVWKLIILSSMKSYLFIDTYNCIYIYLYNSSEDRLFAKWF